MTVTRAGNRATDAPFRRPVDRYGDRMRGSTSTFLGAGCGLVGLALMVVETVRVLNGSTLDTLNNVLLFVGLALLAIGGVLLVIAVVASEDAALDEPAETEPSEEQTPTSAG